MEELETPPEGVIPEPESSGPTQEPQAAGSPETGSPENTEPHTGAAAESQDPQAAESLETSSLENTGPQPDTAAPEAVPEAIADAQEEGQAAIADAQEEGQAAEPVVDSPAVETPGEPPAESVSMEEFLGTTEPAPEAPPASVEDSQLRAVVEAIIYVAEEPLTLAQLAIALQQPASRIKDLLEALVVEFDKPEHGVTIREVAGGFKMATKPEHHDAVRSFVKSLKPPLKLSLPALETLAVIAYKQPVTSPEIMEIRGVRGAGVLNTLLDRKLIAAAGRKNVIGKPILYKTTKEFLIQFGLKDLSELPSLKEFEEIRRMAFADSEVEVAPAEIPEAPATTPSEPAAEPVSETPPAPEGQES